jgi:hypothetical protein
MLRTLICTLVVAALCLSASAAGTKDKKDEKMTKATITKVDAKKGTITVKMTDDKGTTTEKMFELTGEVLMFDDNGKAIK